MSFFSKLFTRNITFIEWMGRDASYQDILHVFGAIRVMPDEGDSFDIYRHSVIDLNSYTVINGLQQRGTEFSVQSEFAKRCLEDMSAKMNRQLKLAMKVEREETEEEWLNDTGEVFETESDSFEEKCEMAVVDADIRESDTGEAKKLPKNALIFTKNKTFEKERFLLCLRKSGHNFAEHQMSGLPDYFRYIFHLKQSGRIVGTYRKENSMGTGGMAFFVMDANTGELLHNDMLK